ncbi:FAD-dependent oxidoreductase [Lipingzhangella sp. LS1_29]|uniref:FAD-dependent oxidoreductase n=1 Tax=Lipingzhangella rawalii TaxID=2055835 RepID=A0ABU2H647_9ACTN|nr:FAD-dependent oxidoreductase [Lipingzhangella rawalii]MDS1270772.1 FAD-dependent oxidoreductase [Lipingzhangella rawalii]
MSDDCRHVESQDGHPAPGILPRQGAGPERTHARRIVVVGNGMTGNRFAQEVVRRDPRGERVRVVLVGAEPGPAYNRVLLPGLLDGTYTPGDLVLPEPAGAVVVRRGETAVSLNPDARFVTLDTGERLGYDELVLATGARAELPPLAGLRAPSGGPGEGVSTLRDMADCQRLRTWVHPGVPMVVLGGGVLGLETARALATAGARVSVVEAAPWIMCRQIDSPAADILTRRYLDLGVRVYADSPAARWLPGTGLELGDGRVLPGDAVVVTAGVRPDTELAQNAGVATDGGVLVDDRLATSKARVHAIGDCSWPPGGGTGLVQPGYRQAEVLADLLTGADPAARYTGTRPVTRLKAAGIELTAMGENVAEEDTGTQAEPTTLHAAHPGDNRVETVTVSDAARGRYAKLTVCGDRLTGAVLLGFPRSAPEVARLFEEEESVPTDRLALLQDPPTASAAPAPEPFDAVVCRCNAVTRSDIEQAWFDGARTHAAIAETTRATTGCGGCTRDIETLLQGLAGQHREPVS